MSSSNYWGWEISYQWIKGYEMYILADLVDGTTMLQTSPLILIKADRSKTFPHNCDLSQTRNCAQEK